jgi:hypothetical protein
MLDFWITEYKSTAISVPTQSSESVGPALDSFQKWAGSSLEPDEYASYLVAPVLPEVTDARSWWLEPT